MPSGMTGDYGPLYQKQFGPGVDLQAAARTRQPPPETYAAARRQRYGMYGSPWGNVPPALEDHLRRQGGVNASALRQQAGLLPVAEGKSIAPNPRSVYGDYSVNSPSLAVAPGWELVEEAPGRWIWTGWERDPEYIAYKEGLKQQRQSVAQQAVKDRPESWSTALFKEDNEMSQIARLFGELGDAAEPVARRGSTQATGGAGQWGATPETPGYLGQQSAALAPLPGSKDKP